MNKESDYKGEIENHHSNPESDEHLTGGWLALIGAVVIVLILLVVVISAVTQSSRAHIISNDLRVTETTAFQDLHICISELSRAVGKEGESLEQLKQSTSEIKESTAKLHTDLMQLDKDMKDWAAAESTLDTIELKGVNHLNEQTIELTTWSENVTNWLTELKSICCYRTGKKITEPPVPPEEKKDVPDSVSGTP